MHLKGKKKSLSKYYIQQWNEKLIKSLKDAFYYAFRFPTEFTDWNTFSRILFENYVNNALIIAKEMKEAKVPEEIIRNFIHYASKIEISREKLEAERKEIDK